MTEVKVKTISGGVYFVKTAEPFEKYVKRMTGFNGYIYASNIIKQPTYIKTDTIESITLIEERGEMNQLRILLHDGSSLILHEDELFNEIAFVLDDFRNDDDYLTIEKDYGRELVLNKGYIVGINVEEADDD